LVVSILSLSFYEVSAVLSFLACVVAGSLDFDSFVCRVLPLALSELLLELPELGG
jgi:hypothetical protein